MRRLVPVLNPEYEIPYDKRIKFEKMSRAFAEKVAPERLKRLSKRGQSDDQKIGQDYYIGVLTEHVVVWILNEEGRDYTQPDLQLYKRGDEKGHAPDTFSKSNAFVPLQIKNITKGGDSWIMEKTVLQDKETWFLLVEFNEINSTIKFPYLKPIKLKKFEHLLREPKLERLTTKVAIYKSDLNELMQTTNPVFRRGFF